MTKIERTSITFGAVADSIIENSQLNLPPSQFEVDFFTEQSGSVVMETLSIVGDYLPPYGDKPKEPSWEELDTVERQLKGLKETPDYAGINLEISCEG